MRTWLFAPGHEARKVGKALESAAARVILDWEDAVPPTEKEAARATTIGALEALEPTARQRVIVRVNRPSSDLFAAETEALEGLLIGGVLIPKVEHPSEIEAAAELDLSMIALIESARGVERVFEIARSHARLRYLAFGPLDLLADVGGHWSPEGYETHYARQKVPIAARAARLGGAIDGPWPALDDLDGLRRDTGRGRRLGYIGRFVIHPKQLPVVSDAYAPTPEERAYARRVVDAAHAAAAQGRGAISVDGRFVDQPVLRWAERLLAESS